MTARDVVVVGVPIDSLGKPGGTELVAALPERPRVLAYAPGAHTRVYWDSVTLPALAFVGSVLGPATSG
jgi:hypothetical protein